MEKGLYMARVSDDTVFTVHADESVIYDAQTRRLFADRDKAKAEQLRTAAVEQRTADRLALKKARKFRAMTKDCACLAGAAALVACTCIWGLYAAIAAIAGCAVALCCRIIHYNKMKER